MHIFKCIKDIDVIFLCCSPDREENNEELYKKIYIDGTTNIIQACRSLNRFIQLIYISSAAVCFNGKDIINGNETTTMRVIDEFIDDQIISSLQSIQSPATSSANTTGTANDKKDMKSQIAPFYALSGTYDLYSYYKGLAEKLIIQLMIYINKN